MVIELFILSVSGTTLPPRIKLEMVSWSEVFQDMETINTRCGLDGVICEWTRSLRMGKISAMEYEEKECSDEVDKIYATFLLK